MMRTGMVSVVSRTRGVRLTDDDQCVPLPLPGLASTVNSGVHLFVGVGDVLLDVLGALVDLLHRGLLLVNQLGNFLV